MRLIPRKAEQKPWLKRRRFSITAGEASLIRRALFSTIIFMDEPKAEAVYDVLGDAFRLPEEN